MIGKLAVISVLLALGSFELANAQTSACTFQMVGTPPVYTCRLIGSNIQSDSDQTLPGPPAHIPPNTDASVLRIEALPADNSHIGVFPHLVIQRFPNVQQVVLDSVNLRQFTAPLPSCASLHTISVPNNQLVNIPTAPFMSCNLTTFDATNNTINNINPTAFLGTNLQNLWLSNNELVVLSNVMLVPIPQLRVLRADNNRIMSLSGNHFVSVPQLTHLWLQSNSLTTWESNFLPNQPHLLELRLDHNQIRNLTERIFANTPAVTTLNLAHNGLQRIEEGSFLNLPALSNLNIADNSLQLLKSESIRPIGQMRTLDVSRNPNMTIERGLFNGINTLVFYAAGNPQCWAQQTSVTITNDADFNNRVAALITNCLSFATSVKINVSILIVSVLLSFLWKM